MADGFAVQMGMENDRDQFAVLVEEVGEFAEAQLKDDPDEIAEELADVYFATRVMATIFNVDLDAAFEEVAAKNLGKSGRYDGGKLIDDSREGSENDR
jgi:NTP pyrophosphatase (non-canonical NTP hydrolase)